MVFILIGFYSRFTQDVVFGQFDIDFGASEVYQSGVYIGYVFAGYVFVYYQVEFYGRIVRFNYNEWYKE